MADEAEGPQGSGQAARKVEARKVEIGMEMVPSLPGGRSVYPAEQEGHFVWLVAEGAMTQECFDEMQGYLRHIAENGLWTQNWDGKPPPDFKGAPGAPE